MRAVLEICAVDQEAAFVCGAWGGLTLDMIEQVEAEVRENPLEGSAGKESVFVSAQWIEDEYDYIGGVRVVINAGYWELRVVDAPVDCTTLHPAAEWTEADGAVLWWAFFSGKLKMYEAGDRRNCELRQECWWSRIPTVELPATKEAK